MRRTHLQSPFPNFASPRRNRRCSSSVHGIPLRRSWSVVFAGALFALAPFAPFLLALAPDPPPFFGECPLDPLLEAFALPVGLLCATCAMGTAWCAGCIICWCAVSFLAS